MLKDKLRRLLGDSNVRRLKMLTGRDHFDEVRLIHEVFRRIGNKGTMVDIGAHYGIELAMFVDLGWEVVAFEPDAKNRKHLEAAFGNHCLVKIDSRAVSDRAEEAKPFFASEQSSGISGLSAFHESHHQTATVNVTTMADIVQQYGLSAIDFLKIDIEGFDFFALKGVDWQAAAPDVIACEFENSKTQPLGYSVADLYAYLSDRGYQVTLSEWHPISEYGARHKWKGFAETTDMLDPKGWGNVIAYRKQPQFDLLSLNNIDGLVKQVYPRMRGN
ncbi:FkbM family methyltransferase [Parasphingorhabdus sp.]|uniref:FkbM family methyltransferase n=1 Tax=Parasphingorhabdus sp. TaxID=2709688 RepID=UPI0030013F7A